MGRGLVATALQAMRAAVIRVATVGAGGDAAHDAARRVYAAACFTAAIPSVHLYRTL